MKKLSGRRTMTVLLTLCIVIAFMPMASQSMVFAKSKKPGKIKTFIVSVSGNKMSAKWTKAKNAKKYEALIQVKKGKKWVKVKDVKGKNVAYSYTIAKGKKYRIHVRGLAKKKGKWTAWKYFEMKKVEPTPVPTGVRITNKTTNSATVSWNGSKKYNYQIRFYNRKTGVNLYYYKEVSNVLSMKCGELDEDTTYEVFVCAYTTTGRHGKWTKGITVTTEKTEVALPAPDTLTASRITNTSMTLDWSAVENRASYKVERKAANENSYTTIKTALTGTSLNVTGLTKNTKYKFRVRAISASGMEGNAIASTFQTSNTSEVETQLPAPTTLTASSITNTSMTLNWSAVANRASYKVEQKTANDSSYTTIKTGLTGTSLNVTGLTKNTQYTFRVRAISSSGMEGTAITKIFQTANIANTEEPLPAPATLTASSITNTSMTLSWSAVENRASYTLEKKNNSTGEFTVVKSGLTATSRNITGLVKNTQYTFRVKAVSSSGMEGTGITKTFSTANVSLDEGPKVGTYTISKGDSESALNNFKIDGITPGDETFLGLVDDGSTLIFSENNYNRISMSDNYLKKNGKMYKLKMIRSSDYTVCYTNSKDEFGLTTKGNAILTATLVNTKDKTDVLTYHFNAINNHEVETYKNYKEFKDNWINENINDNMSIYEKVYKVGYFVGYSYRYVANGSTTGEGLYRNKSGNCWGYSCQAMELCRDMGIDCVTISPTQEDEILHRDVMFLDETGDIYVLYCTAGFSIKKYESAEKLKEDYTCNNVVAFTRTPHDEFKNSFEDFGL